MPSEQGSEATVRSTARARLSVLIGGLKARWYRDAQDTQTPTPPRSSGAARSGGVRSLAVRPLPRECAEAPSPPQQCGLLRREFLGFMYLGSRAQEKFLGLERPFLKIFGS